MSAAAAMSATLVSWSPFFARTRTAAARRSRRVRSRRRSKRFVVATWSEELFISECWFSIGAFLPCQAPRVQRDMTADAGDHLQQEIVAEGSARNVPALSRL